MISGFASMSSLRISTASDSEASSSSTGATFLHGPHHSAQKSTRTGLLDSSTSVWKSASLTALMAPMGILLLIGLWGGWALDG